jgi:hypothetical protein
MMHDDAAGGHMYKPYCVLPNRGIGPSKLKGMDNVLSCHVKGVMDFA